jgi:hypothetical protein
VIVVLCRFLASLLTFDGMCLAAQRLVENTVPSIFDTNYSALSVLSSAPSLAAALDTPTHPFWLPKYVRSAHATRRVSVCAFAVEPIGYAQHIAQSKLSLELGAFLISRSPSFRSIAHAIHCTA